MWEFPSLTHLHQTFSLVGCLLHDSGFKYHLLSTCTQAFKIPLFTGWHLNSNNYLKSQQNLFAAAGLVKEDTKDKTEVVDTVDQNVQAENTALQQGM